MISYVPLRVLQKNTVKPVAQVFRRVEQHQHDAAEFVLFFGVHRLGEMGEEREAEMLRQVLVVPEERLFLEPSECDSRNREPR